MNTTHHHRLHYLLSLLVLILLSVPTDGSLADICSRTRYPHICTETATIYASSLPPSTHVKPADLLKVHVIRATASAEAGKALISRKIGGLSKKVDRMEKQAYSGCKNTYDDIVDNVKDGGAAAAKHDIVTAKGRLSTAMSMCTECDDSFMEAILSNPVQKQNDALRNVISNAASLVKMM